MSRVLLIGFGPIAQKAAKLILNSSHRLVGVVDIDPQLNNKSLGEFFNDEHINIKIENDLTSAIAKRNPEVAVVCTVSSFKLRARERYKIYALQNVPAMYLL